ncbi:MAG TPA: dockerin type I domain-containing protein, partial [Thermoanaerobaculia bacterium]
TALLDGDLNEDGRVDGTDLVSFARRFGASRGERRYDRTADFNGDGRIDGQDLATLAANFGRSSF